MSIRVPENILEIKPYVPGKPIEELERELGIAQSIKLASNENPLGASPMALAALRDAIGNLHRYPDGSGHAFIRDLADHLDCPPGAIVMGNGSDDIIALLANTLLRPGERAVMPQPSFLMYEIAVRSVGAEPVFVPLQSLAIDLDGMRRAVDEKTRLIFLCNPNNPTGTVINGDDFDRFLAALPLDVVVVVDEAYIEFVRDADCLQSKAYWGGGRSVVTLRTFSKLYGLAGLRVGYSVSAPGIAEILDRVRQPFNVNSAAQAAALASLEDGDYLARSVETNRLGLEQLRAGCRALQLDYIPSVGNFLTVDVGRDGGELWDGHLEAAVTGDRKLLRRAMLTDPIVNNIGDADAIIADLLEAERDALPSYWYKRGRK